MYYEGYEDYPPLDDNGNIHGAQPERERFDESIMPNDTFCIDGVVVDNIDRELRGIPKDIYIRKLLELTHSSEEAVIFYREEMSRRARLQPNGPSGVIKTRRKSQRRTAAKKYANDCYTISQFLTQIQPILMTYTGSSRRRLHWSYAIMRETYWL